MPIRQEPQKQAPGLIMPWDKPSPTQSAPGENAKDPVKPSEISPSAAGAVAPVPVPAEDGAVSLQASTPDPETKDIPAPAPVPAAWGIRAVEVTTLQNFLKKSLASKPAVAAYLGQACSWEVSGELLKVWFDNQVAFNLVKPEAAYLTEALGKVAMGVKNVEILEWEEDSGPTPDLDDFDRQVDLIAQVFRGERIMNKTEGEKK